MEFVKLARNLGLFQEEYESAALRAVRSGWYIMGRELETFEREFARYVGKKHCIGVNSGQDALILAVRALGIGDSDEVITQSNAYIASVIGITENRARPVFVEPDKYFGLDPQRLEQAITSRTKAILPVHLYGQICDMESICQVAHRHGLYVIEDCAQAHGANQNGKMAGAFSDIGCFSFYPTKPIGAFGDAGALVTDDDELAEKLRMLRNYGSKRKYVNEINGINSRMDEMQAAILQVGLRHVSETNAIRSAIAKRYMTEIVNEHITLPAIRENAQHVFHIFAILADDREQLQNHLAQFGVQTQIHYPTPPHLAACYHSLGYSAGDFPHAEYMARHELSLPIYAGMPEDDVNAVINCINAYR